MEWQGILLKEVKPSYRKGVPLLVMKGQENMESRQNASVIW